MLAMTALRAFCNKCSSSISFRVKSIKLEQMEVAIAVF
jgi:hypothetical protein